MNQLYIIDSIFQTKLKLLMHTNKAKAHNYLIVFHVNHFHHLLPMARALAKVHMHITVGVYLMKGEVDDQLEWPLGETSC